MAGLTRSGLSLRAAAPLRDVRLHQTIPLLLDGDRYIGVPMAQLFERCGLPYCGTSQRAYNRLYGETPVHTRHRVTQVK